MELQHYCAWLTPKRIIASRCTHAGKLSMDWELLFKVAYKRQFYSCLCNHVYRLLSPQCNYLYQPLLCNWCKYLLHVGVIQIKLSRLSYKLYMLALLTLLFLCTIRPLGHHRMFKPKESHFLRRTDSRVTCCIG
jgi:hypothetical protein